MRTIAAARNGCILHSRQQAIPAWTLRRTRQVLAIGVALTAIAASARAQEATEPDGTCSAVAGCTVDIGAGEIGSAEVLGRQRHALERGAGGAVEQQYALVERLEQRGGARGALRRLRRNGTVDFELRRSRTHVSPRKAKSRPDRIPERLAR